MICEDVGSNVTGEVKKQKIPELNIYIYLYITYKAIQKAE